MEVRPFFAYITIICLIDMYDRNIAMPSSWFEFVVSMNERGWQEERCEYVRLSSRSSGDFWQETGLW